ncbi:MAG: hypothetical protein HY711_01325, partial [Candidatus Melainabacteria bacterium]|nr:hypothetical protein [Candidatus Melainabacteria bacterium]
MTYNLFLVCFAAALIRLPWIFLIPTSEAPDEVAHLWVVRFVCDHLRLPGSGEVAAGGLEAVYGSLPPLGYLPHIVLGVLWGPNDNLLFARFGSLLMGLFTVWAAYQVGQEVFAGKRLVAAALPTLVAFHPQLVFVNSYVNNDSTSIALASLVIYLLVLSIKYGLSVGKSAGLGIVLAYLSLCKYSGYAIFPTVVVAMLLAWWVHKTALWRAIGCVATTMILATLLSGWWFYRNNYEFAGDVLGTTTMYATWAGAFNRELNFHLYPWQVLTDRRWWRFSFFSFWGMFGYMNVFLWRPLYFVYLAFVIAACLGWVRKLWLQVSTKGNVGVLAIWITMAVCFVFNLMAMVFASTVNLGGPQGRYLLVSEIPVCVLILGGLCQWNPKATQVLIIGLLSFNAAVCIES